VRSERPVDLRESLHRPTTALSVVLTGRVSTEIVAGLRVLPDLLAGAGIEVELLAPAGTARILRDHQVEVRELRGLIGRAQLWREAATWARSEILAVVDADGTVDPADLPGLVVLRDRWQVDAVVASTAHPASSWRHRSGRTGHVARRVVDRVVARPGVGDCRVGMKVVRRDLVLAVADRITGQGVLADVELLALARRRGARLLEAPVAYHANLRVRNGLLGDLPHVVAIALRARRRAVLDLRSAAAPVPTPAGATR
jgi:hypothetical protein